MRRRGFLRGLLASVFPLVGIKMVQGDVTKQTSDNPPPKCVPNRGILNRAETHSIYLFSKDGKTLRRWEGYFLFSKNATEEQRRSEFKKYFPLVEEGFKRSSSHVSVSADGLELSCRIEDEEMVKS